MSDIVKRLKFIAKEGFDMCQEFSADHIEITPRNEFDEPVAIVVCTTNSVLAKKIENMLIEFDKTKEEPDE